jgi:hypothetical protein
MTTKSKFQVPSSREASSLKLQTAVAYSSWILLLGISLELGTWNLELPK